MRVAHSQQRPAPVWLGALFSLGTSFWFHAQPADLAAIRTAGVSITRMLKAELTKHPSKPRLPRLVQHYNSSEPWKATRGAVNRKAASHSWVSEKSLCKSWGGETCHQAAARLRDAGTMVVLEACWALVVDWGGCRQKYRTCLFLGVTCNQSVRRAVSSFGNP